MNVISGIHKDGKLILLVDGEVLSPVDSQKILNHSDEFNAGYEGSGPAQSALAILFHVLKDKDRAVRLHQRFKREFLSHSRYLKNDFEFRVNVKQWATLQELGF